MEWSGVEGSGLEWSEAEKSGVEWSGVEWSGANHFWPNVIQEDSANKTPIKTPKNTTHK